MNSANSILGKLHIFMKSQAHLFVVKIWLEKAKNMVLFCVLRLWHINLGMCRAQNKLAVKQKGT